MRTKFSILFFITAILVSTSCNGMEWNRKTHALETASKYIKEKSREALKACLMQNQFLVYEKTPDGNSLLHLAVLNFWPEGVRLLLDRGAPIDAFSGKTLTALHIAVKQLSTAILRLLIERKAQLNSIDQYGETPLHYAAARGYAHIVRRLLDAGADPFAVSKRGDTPLNNALRASGPACAHVLINTIRMRFSDGGTVYSVALQSVGAFGSPNEHFQNKQALETCLQQNHKLLVAAQSQNGFYLLHHAAVLSWEDGIKLLLQFGAALTARNPNGATALHVACTQENTHRGIQLLIDRGANVDERDHYGKTPLHYAALQGRTKAAVALLNNNAHVNAQTQNGFTPLQLAATKRHPAFVTLLIDKIIDNAGSNEEERKLARKDYYSAFAAVEVEQFHAKLIDSERHLRLFTELLNRNGTFLIRSQNSNGFYLINLAARSGRLKYIQLLVEHGADIDAKEPDGKTSLHWAISQSIGYEELIEFLLANGASIEEEDAKGKTPLQLAIAKQRTGVSSLLLTRFAYADQCSQTRIIRLLPKTTSTQVNNIRKDRKKKLSAQLCDKVPTVIAQLILEKFLQTSPVSTCKCNACTCPHPPLTW